MEICSIPRKEKDGSSKDIRCPNIVRDYNAHMGYVDKMDMLKSIYEIDRKSKKWWHRIMWYFLDVSIVNSFILFKHRTGSSIPNLKVFRVSVATGLIGAGQPARSRAQPKVTNHFKRTVPYEIRYDQCLHMPVYSKSRRCAFCSNTQDPHRTRWTCSTCDVGFCLNDKKNCFQVYHQK
ncbi:hypothetical protein NQ314_021189 [Rhamnusium bicolor]|uniref:PiggyBac transposable element-derived protein domain-containing protein n=1 Tax=Rhamnusium bicolor TaxID=1586634 RepID=A0AAV8WJ51_9CUCU|nr:hypothetical protein NQ314_021189 [Rhamnusium bicolor]